MIHHVFSTILAEHLCVFLINPSISLPKSWDELGTNYIEQYSYDELYENGKAGAMALGFSDEMWDCHINHYQGYWWSDLEDSGLDQYLIVLGWDENSWDNINAPVPETETLYWDSLTPEEQSAARQICYFEDVWNGVPIPDWEFPNVP
mmetsp:Transcript_18071/g.31126  ORF Transcript_18071/g.31126 Transcript_18071/m.31126 type:complete len:148 (-) Transcript_18071:125-568(-)